jgi:hypothetical protein
MKRRDFMKSGLVSVASASALSSAVVGIVPAQGQYEEGRKVSLGNPYLDWNILLSGGSLRSVRLRNKLSGRDYELGDSREFRITLAAAKTRIEIPWWYVQMGPNNDDAAPENERGLEAGYHLRDFPDEEQWGTTLNLLLRAGERVDAPPVFNGYGWFRQWFELPKDAEGSPLVLCLGGYTQEDWKQYWVFLNGKPVGNWKHSGRWRTPEELALAPGSPEYSAFRFGGGERNLLAVRTCQVDRRFEGMREEILDRYIFEGRLSDQFISVGQPYLHVADFKLNHWQQIESAERPGLVFELSNSEQQLGLTVHYELAGFVRRKWFEIKNTSAQDRLLLDVDVDDFVMNAAMTEGDQGLPVIVEKEVFCAVEHPAATRVWTGESACGISPARGWGPGNR